MNSPGTVRLEAKWRFMLSQAGGVGKGIKWQNQHSNCNHWDFYRENGKQNKSLKA